MTAAHREGLGQLVSAHVAEVAQEAMRLAHDTAVTRLVNLLADELVEAALHELAARPESQPAPTPAAAEPTPDGAATTSARPAEGLYCYAITWADTPAPEVPSLTHQSTVALVPDGDLALVVSRERLDDLDVDEDDLSEEGALARMVRGHDAVVRAAFERGPVLPLRFATVVPDESGARALLRTHTAAAERLRHVEGATEWGLRLMHAPEHEPVPAPRRTPGRPGTSTPSASASSAASAGSGTEYLSRRRELLRTQEADREAAARAADTVTARLSYTVDVIRHTGAPGALLLLDAAFLVARSTESRFLEDVDRLTDELAEHGLLLERTGPWPPYSFATLPQEVADATT